MVSMFEVAKPELRAAGMVIGPDWDQTKAQTFSQARRQLRRTNLKPATASKWNGLAFITQPAPPAVVFPKNTERSVAA